MLTQHMREKMAKKANYNLATGRYADQITQMKDLAERGVCAFCPEHIDKEHREPVELQTEHWMVAKNDYPYEGTKLHLLLIPKVHVHTLSKLSRPALHDLTDLIVSIEKKWGLTHYAVGIRSGDMHHTGGSVEHLHAHLVVGDTEADDHQPVRFKMSSKP